MEFVGSELFLGGRVVIATGNDRGSFRMATLCGEKFGVALGGCLGTGCHLCSELGVHLAQYA